MRVARFLKSIDSQVNIIYRGVVLPYVSHIGMCHPKGWSLRSFGLKMAKDLAHFGLEYARLPAAIRENEPALIPPTDERINDRTRETAEMEPRSGIEYGFRGNYGSICVFVVSIPND